jgi:hypothetical protein
VITTDVLELAERVHTAFITVLLPVLVVALLAEFVYPYLSMFFGIPTARMPVVVLDDVLLEFTSANWALTFHRNLLHTDIDIRYLLGFDRADGHDPLVALIASTTGFQIRATLSHFEFF